ncbi:MAG: hypothetical protein AUI60_02515 [Thaumarchaeota archaeon 13_1_40CM_2_39_4]|nr:MAG: hypothetical protein AUI60_02515 [Thaumarchaeota archaeon 13_1_40CM_2_39_4]
MSVKCADCLCEPEECSKRYFAECKLCIKDDCCCVGIHARTRDKTTIAKFFLNVKNMYVSALTIEILCIMSAEIGENSGFFLFGYQKIDGISIGFVLGYALAGFSTFATILGRYNVDNVIDGCCSSLDCKDRRFTPNLKTTFRNFAVGITKMPFLYKQPYARQILKTSIYVLVVSESLCILTALTVDFIFYRHSLWLSIPLALFAGAFSIAALESYRKIRSDSSNTNLVSFKKK